MFKDRKIQVVVKRSDINLLNQKINNREVFTLNDDLCVMFSETKDECSWYVWPKQFGYSGHRDGWFCSVTSKYKHELNYQHALFFFKNAEDLHKLSKQKYKIKIEEDVLV